MPKIRRLDSLLPLVEQGLYRLGPHVARHMVQEGFDERDLLQALRWGRELAVYPEDERMLVLGYMIFGSRLKLPLHIVLDYSRPRWVDIVTAFIPDRPHHVYSRARLAALIRYDGGREELSWAAPDEAALKSVFARGEND
ncbi:DUF4258 domain-containing protein [Oceanithermus sp.]